MPSFHPLATFNNKTVLALLSDFFEQNCQLAGAKLGLGSNLVTFIWQNKENQYEQLRLETQTLLKQIIKSCTTKSEETNTLNLLSLKNDKVVVDIGANKLTAINSFGARFSQIEKLIAVDIVPQQRAFRFPEKSQYIQVDPKKKELPIASGSVDVVQIKFVLHHLTSLEKINETLHEAHRMLRPGGRCIIWEESFTQSYSQTDLATAHNLGVLTDQNLTDRFYQLNDTQKWMFITMLDWIINVGNPHMPWTGQYYDWLTWCQMLEEVGFSKQREINLGLRLNGKIKQGVHMLGEFGKDLPKP